VAEFQAFERQATKALTKLQAVTRLVELRNPPSNRFEALSGERKGQYSIRINDQWRVCFQWSFTQARDGLDGLMAEGEACEVEIVDYHRS
jgi:proteic killer suppression protein